MTKKDDTQAKSWLLFVAGLVGIGFQQYTHQVDWPLLLIFTVMTGTLPVSYVLSLLKNSPEILSSSSAQPASQESDSDNSSQKLDSDE